MTTSTADWAVRYIQAYQFKLVSIPRGCKGPIGNEWNKRGRYVEDVEKAKLRWGNGTDEGIGVVLGPSGVCSADIDFVEHAELVLSELGLNLPSLRKAGPTIRGNPERYRLMFAAPPGVVLSRKSLVWPPKEPGGKPFTIFELRGGNIQDVLPPTEHPDFHLPYIWEVAPNGAFPPVPPDLLELWQHWESYQKELEAMCPWGNINFNPKPAPRGAGARPNVIAAFNQARTVEELLAAHKYERRGGNRWLSPTSRTGLAGVTILDGRVYSHHASDPLSDKHSHDAFDVYRILVHSKDMRSAIKAAAEELGIDRREPPIGEAPGCEDRVILVRGDTLRVKPIRWLWDGFLALEHLHMLAGAPGAGKSTVASRMSATVTTGGQWPDGTTCSPGDVIVWSDEDSPEHTLLPRFLAAGGDPRRFHIVKGTVNRDGVRQFDPAIDIPKLLAASQEVPGCALMILDPVVTIVPGDSHKNTEVRRALQPLVGFASDLSIAVLGISHFTKGTAGRDPVERVTGSVAFGAKPRVVMAAAKIQEGDTERRIFCRSKSNIGPDDGGWQYRLVLTDVPGVPEVAPVVVARWGEALTGSARDLLSEADASSDPEERSALAEAVDWLLHLLKDGPANSKQIPLDAKHAGIAWPTVLRAKRHLGVTSYKRGFAAGWWWSLPEHSTEDDQASRAYGGTAGDDHLRASTPLKPSCGAGSTEGDQGGGKTTHKTPLKPSCGAGSTEGDQGFDHLRGLRYPRVVITIDAGTKAHRSFESGEAPEGMTLEAWQAKVVAAYGPSATVRPVGDV